MNAQTKLLKKTYRKMAIANGNKSPFKQWVINLASAEGPVSTIATAWIRNKGIKRYHKKPVRV